MKEKRKIAYIIFVIIILFYCSKVVVKSIQLYRFERVPLSQIHDYYIDINVFKDSAAVRFDLHHVATFDYGKVSSSGVDNTISYNPITISLMGLKLLQESDTMRFLAQSEWMASNQSKEGYWYLNHEKHIDSHSLKPPWTSGLAQGLGISLLTRAFIITGDSSYYFKAIKGMHPFSVPLEEGGILFQDSIGVFYEEYPLVENPTHVLNGHIYSLFGLYDLVRYVRSEEAKLLFDQGVESLENRLDEYDAGFWSYYSLNQNPSLENHYNLAAPLYQKLHVIQLQGLYLITAKEKFKEKKEAFESQMEKSWFNYIVYPAYIIYIDFVWLKRNIG